MKDYNSSRDQFILDTIDKFVDFHINWFAHRDVHGIPSLCKFLVNVHACEVIELLKSKHNKPSKYDLMIIDCMIKSDSDFSGHLKLYSKRNIQQLEQSNINHF